MFTPTLNINKPNQTTYVSTNPFTTTNLMEGQKTLDPDSQARLENVTQNALNGADADRAFVDKDVADTQKYVPGAGQIGQATQIPGLADALARRSQRDYSDKIQSAKTLSDIESPYQQFDRLSKVGQMQNSFQNLKIKNYKEQMQYVLQQRQAFNEWQRARSDAQSQFLGGLLGGLGSLGGAILGSSLSKKA